MIVLNKFNTKSDLKRLISWVDTARLNIIWASDKFNFPLTESALVAYFQQAEQNGILAFKVIDKENSKAIGHAELEINGKEIKISRLLISKQNRGKGYGKKMMIALLQYIEENIAYENIVLTVFTFNKPAIGIYEKMGFETIEIDRGFMEFEGEEWDRQKMVMKKNSGGL